MPQLKFSIFKFIIQKGWGRLACVLDFFRRGGGGFFCNVSIVSFFLYFHVFKKIHSIHPKYNYDYTCHVCFFCVRGVGLGGELGVGLGGWVLGVGMGFVLCYLQVII